jgi:8-oxo-dGTP pyrophosphatase MutT (NUDIX family)
MQHSEQEILGLLDIVRAIAQEGLSYTKNEYDIARYEKLLELTSNTYSRISDITPEEVGALLRKEHGSITPKLGIDVAVMNMQGELLVLKRSDDECWGLPCGWADVDETPFQTAVREVQEETGLEVTPTGYIAISQKGPHNYPGCVHQVNICVATAKVSNTSLVKLSSEHTDYAWITRGTNKNWHRGHERLIDPIFETYKKQTFIKDIP